MTAEQHANEPVTPATGRGPAPGAAWLDAASVRRSRRRFDGAALDPAVLDRLDEAVSAFSPYPDARVVLVREPGEGVFSGVVGSYGKITGSRHVLLIIANEHSEHAHAHAGYTGEAALLEATAMGLDTCWIGGFFNAARVAQMVSLAHGERVVAVTPVGHATDGLGANERLMRGLAGSHGRKPLDTIAPGSDAWPEWARSAAECARIAPSAMNRQPWRLRLDADGLVVSRDAHREAPRVTRALDCGIAMLHAELGAMGAGVTGGWTDLGEGLDVARFLPNGT